MFFVNNFSATFFVIQNEQRDRGRRRKKTENWSLPWRSNFFFIIHSFSCLKLETRHSTQFRIWNFRCSSIHFMRKKKQHAEKEREPKWSAEWIFFKVLSSWISSRQNVSTKYANENEKSNEKRWMTAVLLLNNTKVDRKWHCYWKSTRKNH